jgi:4-hydroxybenzoate polyprenyltransferase
MEDIEGDKAIGAKSFPIVLGEKQTKRILVIGSFLLIAALSYVSYSVYNTHSYVSYYLLGMVVLPLIYFIVMLVKASTKNDFHKLSAILKLIMLLGILSMLII